MEPTNTDTNTNATAAAPATQTPAAKAKRAATVTGKREQKAAQRGYTLPLVLTCHVTGKSVKYTSAAYIDKTIAKFGSLDKLLAGYVSRDGRAQVKAQAVATAPAEAPKPAKAAKASKAVKA